MTTEEMDALYLKHAPDFRELLGTRSALAVFDDALLRAEDGRWFWAMANGGSAWEIPRQMGVAAVTEFWRERLEKEHEILLAPRLTQRPVWFVLRACRTGKDENVLSPDGTWQPFNYKQRDACYKSLPEALCAVVHALAEEKRAAEKPMTPTKARAALDKLWAETHAPDLFQALGAQLVADIVADQMEKAEKSKSSAAAIRAAVKIEAILVRAGCSFAPDIAAIIDAEFPKDKP